MIAVALMTLGMNATAQDLKAAKELIMGTGIPYIINAGRKGGSNVAAAIINAVLYQMREEN